MKNPQDLSWRVQQLEEENRELRELVSSYSIELRAMLETNDTKKQSEPKEPLLNRVIRKNPRLLTIAQSLFSHRALSAMKKFFESRKMIV